MTYWELLASWVGLAFTGLYLFAVDREWKQGERYTGRHR